MKHIKVLKTLHNRKVLVIFVERGSKYQIFPGLFPSKSEKHLFYNFNKETLISNLYQTYKNLMNISL